ncbi:MAG TPA: hypothetical protein DDW17_02865 [Deltaproteobacteria bacterium]|nr:hypothetical protein [Deltaproteobacteria bacterium]
MTILSETKGRFTIRAYIKKIGDDLLVVLSGGKKHIGAAGFAQPRPSLKNKNKISATSSVYTYLGHKEDTIVKSISEELSKRLNRKVVVLAGIHWDNIRKKDIEIVKKLCGIITQKIIKSVAGVC